MLFSLLGPFWTDMAQCRQDWRLASATIVEGYLKGAEVEGFMGLEAAGPGPPAGLRPFGALAHISNRCHDMLGLGRMKSTRTVSFVSDCAVVVDSVAGRCSFSSDTDNMNLYRNCVRWYLYMFMFRWNLRSDGDILRHLPREMNAEADSLVNLVQDGAVDQLFWIMPGLGALPPEVPIEVFSDGGVRQDSGRSAVAVVARACPQGAPSFVVAYWARGCREQNSVYAEFEGAIDACRLLVQICYESDWVVGGGPCARPEFA
jgi:hypothetical protein